WVVRSLSWVSSTSSKPSTTSAGTTVCPSGSPSAGSGSVSSGAVSSTALCTLSEVTGPDACTAKKDIPDRITNATMTVVTGWSGAIVGRDCFFTRVSPRSSWDERPRETRTGIFRVTHARVVLFWQVRGFSVGGASKSGRAGFQGPKRRSLYLQLWKV